MSSAALAVGDRVKVFLNSRHWRSTGWLEGTVVRIDPYSAHRSFHWVELDVDAQPLAGGSTRLVSVLNPAHIERMQDDSDPPPP
jgi:hypothetical protein